LESILIAVLTRKAGKQRRVDVEDSQAGCIEVIYEIRSYQAHETRQANIVRPVRIYYSDQFVFGHYQPREAILPLNRVRISHYFLPAVQIGEIDRQLDLFEFRWGVFQESFVIHMECRDIGPCGPLQTEGPRPVAEHHNDFSTQGPRLGPVYHHLQIGPASRDEQGETQFSCGNGHKLIF
jgi:hypothetical protein